MKPLALTGVRIWDGLCEERSPHPGVVRIEDGRIAAIGDDRRLADGAEVLELPGATAIPGLIDAHVHIGLDPALKTPDEQLAVSADDRRSGMESRAAAMVAAGITTARDLGGGDWTEISLRDRILAGGVPGPRLLCAGQPVTTPKGHCHFWGGEAADRPAIRAVIERQVAHGADWIKVMATGGVFTRGTSSQATQFDLETLKFLVSQAADHERPVAAHCHGTEGIAFAIESGVRTIEHCSFAGAGGFGSAFDSALLVRMVSRGVFVSPTVNAGWGRRIEHEGAPTDFYRRMSHALHALVQAEVGLIASTDAGIPGVEHHRLPEALSVFARYTGLRPVDVLRSATSRAAHALGVGHETGVLAPGLAADVLVVEGDPTEDLSALQRPRCVLARGVRQLLRQEAAGGSASSVSR